MLFSDLRHMPLNPYEIATSGMRRIVIAGLPRCGTTLLAAMLQQQRRSYFITDYVNWARDASRRLERARNDALSASEKRVALALARDSWLRLQKPILTGLDDFETLDDLDTRISAEVTPDDTDVFGHKTLLTPDEIEDVLTNTLVHVIVMIRDPRDAALSYYSRVGSGVEAYIDQWRGMVQYCWNSTASRLLSFEFERLVTDPTSVLDRLQRWWSNPMQLPGADLQFHQGHSDSTEWSDNSAFFDVTKTYDRSAVGRWQSHLRSPIVQYADYVCREEIAQLGLEPFPRRSMRTDLRMHLHASYWRFDQWLDIATRRARKRLRERVALSMRS